MSRGTTVDDWVADDWVGDDATRDADSADAGDADDGDADADDNADRVGDAMEDVIRCLTCSGVRVTGSAVTDVCTRV